MSLINDKYEMINPIEISVFCYKAVVFDPDKDSELVELHDKAVLAGKFWFVFHL